MHKGQSLHPYILAPSTGCCGFGTGNQDSICAAIQTPSRGLPRLVNTPVAVHPLPQRGEGSRFISMFMVGTKELK